MFHRIIYPLVDTNGSRRRICNNSGQYVFESDIEPEPETTMENSYEVEYYIDIFASFRDSYMHRSFFEAQSTEETEVLRPRILHTYDEQREA